MSIFDAIELGGELVSAGKTISTLNKIKEKDPKLHATINVLTKVCNDSNANFKPRATREDSILLMSKELEKGLFSSEPFSCAVFPLPGEEITEFVYIPEGVEFVASSSEPYSLLNWINHRLIHGKFLVQRRYKNNVGKEIVQLAYRVALDHKGINPYELEGPFSALLGSVLTFRNEYLAFLQGAANLEFQFHDVRENNELLAKYGIEEAKPNRILSISTINSSNHPGLFNVMEYLEENLSEESFEPGTSQIEFIVEQNGVAYPLKIQLGEESIITKSVHGKLSDMDCYSLIQSDLLSKANNLLSLGNLHINQASNEFVYMLGLEHKSFSPEALRIATRNLLGSHQRAASVIKLSFEELVEIQPAASNIDTRIAKDFLVEATQDVEDENANVQIIEEQGIAAGVDQPAPEKKGGLGGCSMILLVLLVIIFCVLPTLAGLFLFLLSNTYS